MRGMRKDGIVSTDCRSCVDCDSATERGGTGGAPPSPPRPDGSPSCKGGQVRASGRGRGSCQTFISIVFVHAPARRKGKSSRPPALPENDPCRPFCNVRDNTRRAATMSPCRRRTSCVEQRGVGGLMWHSRRAAKQGERVGRRRAVRCSNGGGQHNAHRHCSSDALYM